MPPLVPENTPEANAKFFATKETVDKRRETCNTCEHCVEQFTVKVCSLCGCVIHTKSLLLHAQCPANKW